MSLSLTTPLAQPVSPSLVRLVLAHRGIASAVRLDSAAVGASGTPQYGLSQSVNSRRRIQAEITPSSPDRLIDCHSPAAMVSR